MDEAPQSDHNRVQAVHADWKGTLRLSTVGNKVTHEEFGSRGVYTLLAKKLVVTWDNYPPDTFIEINGAFIQDRILQNAHDSLGDGERIPPLIFQTRKSKISLPENFRKWSLSFSKFNPSYSIKLWDDDDNRNFIKNEFSWFYDTYTSYPKEIYRVDAIRYFFLYKFGGIYADLDVECLKPLDELLTSGNVVLGRMGSDPTHPHSIPNAIMASRPREEFWLLVIWLMMHVEDRTQSPEFVTGPVLLKAAVDLYSAKDPLFVKSAIAAINARLPGPLKSRAKRSDIRIMPPHALFPLDWTDFVHQALRLRVLNGHVLSQEETRRLFPKAWMTTYWAHSWS